MTSQTPLSDLFRCTDGGWSCMRVIAFLTCTVVLSVWALCCLLGGAWIPISWEMVALVGGAQGAKAVQSRFECRPQGRE
ncbi:MAG: hypothetical protein PHN64_04580 [Desulfovibrionaceae bacterium]|nr:hypothetical protein [Desulfovibrionaceae bacterium]